MANRQSIWHFWVKKCVVLGSQPFGSRSPHVEGWLMSRPPGPSPGLHQGMEGQCAQQQGPSEQPDLLQQGPVTGNIRKLWHLMGFHPKNTTRMTRMANGVPPPTKDGEITAKTLADELHGWRLGGFATNRKPSRTLASTTFANYGSRTTPGASVGIRKLQSHKLHTDYLLTSWDGTGAPLACLRSAVKSGYGSPARKHRRDDWHLHGTVVRR